MSATAPETRVRARKPDLSPAYAAELVHGREYHLLSPEAGRDQIFRRGERVAIDEETYRRLANATETQTIVDGEYGRIQRVRRKFKLTPELPMIVEERYVDLRD